jgi:hypothetical protein
MSLIIKNLGASPFTVTNYTGGAVVAIPSGTAWFVYVTSNLTSAGAWGSMQFGAATSVANASGLAGPGLFADGSRLETVFQTSSVYSDTTLTNANQSRFLVWSSGAGTITLPPSAGVYNGWFIIIRNNGSGILTMLHQGADTIDGNAAQQLQLANSLVLVNNGAGWNSFGFGQSATFTYTQLAKTATGGTVTLTAAEAANVIQNYTGTLTSNCTVILPSTVQLYSLSNQTTGAFTLTFKTAAVGGGTIVLAQGGTVIAVCDGTNVYNASTATVGAVTQITLGPGSAGSPSVNFTGNTQTGLFLPSSTQVGISIANAQILGIGAAGNAIPGIACPLGISGGTF